MSVLVPLTNFKATSPQILLSSSSSDYTLPTAVDWWLIHVGAHPAKGILLGTAKLQLTLLLCFVLGQNSLFESVFWGLRLKLLQRRLRWVTIWKNSLQIQPVPVNIFLLICVRGGGGLLW